MKKSVTLFLVVSMALLIIAGCGEKSGTSGKVLDGQSQPLSGLKVIAKKLDSANEQFETTTAPDGTFRFDNLDPLSNYVITVWHKDWSTNAEAHVTTGPGGETVKVHDPIKVMVAVNTKGMVMDPQINKPWFILPGNPKGVFDSDNGLEWFVGPDKKTTWDQAKAWCDSLPVGGGGWRMPTRDDLETLNIKNLDDKNIAPAFKSAGWWVWSGEHYDSSSAWHFPFPDGREHDFDPNYSGNIRAFAVRTRK
jgi:hypothetical protein